MMSLPAETMVLPVKVPRAGEREGAGADLWRLILPVKATGVAVLEFAATA